MKYKELTSVLLVDDDKFTNLIHTKAIERTGIQVAVKAVSNVTDALAFLTSEEQSDVAKPSIIFLDINMPGLTGWDFMKAYRQLEERFKVKVIVTMLTTSLNPDDEQRARLDNQIVNFFQKPLRPEMFVKLVEEHFEPEP